MFVAHFFISSQGYLFMLYALVIVIRFFLVFAFYPITANIGIGSSWVSIRNTAMYRARPMFVLVDGFYISN